MDFGPGRVVAGYRLERELGRGGMGVVYVATQLSLERTVALKLVAPAHAADLAFRERFRREGLVQAALDHPNIVTVFEAGEFEGAMFIAMRFVEGFSLKELILERAVDAQRALRILGPVADALDSAHEVGLIHRDVKPHNVLVGRRDRAFLADFGLTKSRDGSSMTQTGQFVGSIDYIAPEQIRGEPVTSQTDIYALGAVLFECLTGVVPFPKDSDAAVLYAHMSDPPPRATDHRPRLPAEIDLVLARALAKDPQERYERAGDLMRAAARALEDAHEEPVQPVEATRPEDRGIRRAEADVATRPPAAVELPETLGPTPSPAPRAVRPGGPARSGSLRRRRGAAVAGVCTAVLLVGAAFLVGRAGPDGPAAARRVAAGNLSVTSPPGWRGSATTARIPGLALEDPITLESPAGGALFTAGAVTGVADRTLLPAALLRRVKTAPRPEEAVALGELRAYRYPRLRITGQPGTVTVYVTPTEEGVFGAACTGSASPPPTCEPIAATIVTKGSRPLELGPQPGYARRLGSAVEELGRVPALVRRLRTARRSDTQARTITGLADAHRRAVAALGSAAPGPEARAAATGLKTALQEAAGAYAAMARAARAGAAATYSRSRTGVFRAEERIRRELARLASYGYGRP